MPVDGHSDRAQEFDRLDVLDEGAARARPQSLEDIGVEGVVRQDQHTRVDAHVGDPAGGLDGVHPRLLDVHEDHVRPDPLGEGHGFGGVGSLLDDVDVGSELRSAAKPTRING